MCHARHEKWKTTYDWRNGNHDKIRTLEENETYKYLGILEVDTIKQVRMKDTTRKEYLRKTRKLLETKLSSKGINTWALSLVRYSGPFPVSKTLLTQRYNGSKTT